MRKEIVIDGSRFDDLAGFYDEVERVLTKGLSWRIGRSLNAFSDVLRGGFGVHEFGEPIAIKWLHFDKSKKDFAYRATAEYYKDGLKHCHPSSADSLRKALKNALDQTGPTLMDIILELILDTGDSGHDCTFEPVDG